MQNSPVITLTTDFGLEDPFAGVMKGVIMGINPRAAVIDLSHGIASHDIRGAALTIGMNYGFFPERTAHVVVVDPGVGSRRRPLLVATEAHYFIGPDNGIFSSIFEKERDSLRVIHITAGHYFLRTMSPTFQGRDVFAPVAAWLTRGKNFRNFGEEITDYETIDLPMPALKKNILKGEVIFIDKFGNAMTNVGRAEIDALSGRPAGRGVKVFLGKKEVPLSEFYGQAAGRGLHAVINSSEYLEFFVNRGNAARKFDISVGDIVEIKKRP